MHRALYKMIIFFGIWLNSVAQYVNTTQIRKILAIISQASMRKMRLWRVASKHAF